MRSTIDGAKIIADYQSGLSLRAVGAIHGCANTVVYKHLLSEGVRIRSKSEMAAKFFAPEQLKQVRAEYDGGESAYVLARRYGTDATVVINALRRAGVTTRTCTEAAREYDVNESAFDVLTDDVAYWCGVMITDGCIHEGNRTNAAALSLRISAKDAGHLEQFKRFLGSTHPVRTFQPKRYKNSFNSGLASVLKIRSNRLCDGLRNLGITERKTRSAVAHDSLASNPHFWRGCIDGDGSVFLAKQKYPCISLCGGSLALMNQYRDFVLRLCPECKATIRPMNNTIWSIAVNGSVNAVAVIAELYGRGGVSLARKQEKANYILQTRVSRRSRQERTHR
jgi:hypothetical protein